MTKSTAAINATFSNDNGRIDSIPSEPDSIDNVSELMLATFIISGIVITFWSLCICGLSICLLKLYYQRKKKEILLKNHIDNNNNDQLINIQCDEDNTDDETIEMTKNPYHHNSQNFDTNNEDEGVYKNCDKHQQHNHYYDGLSNDSCTMATTMNTSKIIQQTDGMETSHLAVIINCEDEESRASDDDIYDNPNSNHKHKRTRKQIGFNGEIVSKSNNDNNNTQSINMEESHNRDISSYTVDGGSMSHNPGKDHKHTILSDHNTYPSLPSYNTLYGGNSSGNNGVVDIHQSHIPPSSFSAIYEKCATPDGYTLNGTNNNQILETQQDQHQITAKYYIASQQ